eukprot:CAMPEP_0202813158 /NCGR_PEP_ID=MMETSP1389-20130828/4623_1 /ASSEMBLY_ACC=CAM_ASM_000865 /TAXON_ID=302021 /ORGANISM="Rhodomonas sp., Strain CCMP768" /LENGTH=783 /DNA_ID=CAMNT_0049484711 /DNA_START=5 /DNA_END=2356 /DNA_ORIENTATION=+
MTEKTALQLTTEAFIEKFGQSQVGLFSVWDGAEGCVPGQSAFVNIHGYQRYNDKTYDGACSFFEDGDYALPEWVGWFIICVLGLFFAALTTLMVWINGRRYPASDVTTNSEQFSCAGRDIPAGLTAADVVSKWTWAATLLQSSNVAYNYGVSGPFWYAAGATIQVLLFAILAVEIKRKCPAIHTVLEVVLVRWGPAAHFVFLFFCLSTNLIVTGMLILGGAAAVEALSGVSTYASCFLIPLGVSTYTAFGGLKGTYYASWTHTFIIYIALLTFIWKVYAGPSDLGSAGKVWENLNFAAIKAPSTTNKDFSYITMFSEGGMIFGVINIIGNFGTVFVDQSYWQGAIACRPAATWRGYLLGGMAWFAIPFSMATTLGLAARALDLPLTSKEAGAGLVPPAVALHLMGRGGAFLVTLQLFLAVTSTANSEQLAVSSLFAYDIYKMYINPKAEPKQLISVSRMGILAWAILSGVFGVILFELDIGLGWVYVAMGNFIGSAVTPICFSLLWKDCTATGAIAGAVLGLLASIVGWVSMADSMYGEVTVDSLGSNYPVLIGNLNALVFSTVIAVVVSFMQGGQNFDWEELDTRTNKYLVEDDPNAHLKHDGGEDSKETMDAVFQKIVASAMSLTFILILLWPIYSLPAQVFSQRYFEFWVAIAFIWGHVAAFITIIYPIWEVREDVIGVLTGKPPPPPPQTAVPPEQPKAETRDLELQKPVEAPAQQQAQQMPAGFVYPHPMPPQMQQQQPMAPQMGQYPGAMYPPSMTPQAQPYNAYGQVAPMVYHGMA